MKNASARSRTERRAREARSVKGKERVIAMAARVSLKREEKKGKGRGEGGRR